MPRRKSAASSAPAGESAAGAAPAKQPPDPREENGTGEKADEQQLGVTDEEVTDLEDDAKGG